MSRRSQFDLLRVLTAPRGSGHSACVWPTLFHSELPLRCLRSIVKLKCPDPHLLPSGHRTCCSPSAPRPDMRPCAAPCSGGNPDPSLTPHAPACPQHPHPRVSPIRVSCPSHAQRDPPKVSHVTLLPRPCRERRRLHRGPWGSAWPGPRLPPPPLRSAVPESLWPRLLLPPPEAPGSSRLPCPVSPPGASSGPAPSFSVPAWLLTFTCVCVDRRAATAPVFALHPEVRAAPPSPRLRPAPAPAVPDAGPRGLSAGGSSSESPPPPARPLLPAPPAPERTASQGSVLLARTFADACWVNKSERLKSARTSGPGRERTPSPGGGRHGGTRLSAARRAGVPLRVTACSEPRGRGGETGRAPQ